MKELAKAVKDYGVETDFVHGFGPMRKALSNFEKLIEEK